MHLRPGLGFAKTKSLPSRRTLLIFRNYMMTCGGSASVRLFVFFGPVKYSLDLRQVNTTPSESGDLTSPRVGRQTHKHHSVKVRV